MDRRSLKKLNGCHFDLVRLFLRVDQIVPITVICGPRGQEAQDEAYALNNSTKKFPESVHNKVPSEGVDAGPKPIDWGNTKLWYHFGGLVRGIAAEMRIEIRWGGDWDGDFDLTDQKLMDLCHFELRSFFIEAPI